MPRRVRVPNGGYAYQELNPAVGRMRVFGKQRDSEAAEEVIAQTVVVPSASRWNQGYSVKSLAGASG